MTALVEETHDLVEEHLPEIDVEPAAGDPPLRPPAVGVATLSGMTRATAVSFPFYAYVARGYLR